MASNVRQDNVQVKLEIEANQAKVELDNLHRKKQILEQDLKGLKKGTEEYIQKNKELKEVDAAMASTRKELGLSGMTLQQLNRTTKDLQRELIGLTPGTATFIAKSRELTQVKARAEEVRKAMNGISDELDKGGNGFSDFAKKALAFAGINMGVEAVVDGAMQAAAAVAETVKEFEQLRKTINQLTGAEGEELDQLTSRVAGLAKTYGKDLNEVLIASNAVAKQMGISQEQALEVIEKGFVAGADAGGEFLDQLREYPTHFKSAQMSAEEMVAVITQSTKDGVFSDKGADVVKEFGLRIREQTTATRDALENAFGEDFTQKLFKGLNDGSITTVEALKLVSQGLSDTSLTAAQTQLVVADVFGGPGEDAGIEYLQSLKNVAGGMDELIDKSNPYQKRQLELIKSNQDLAAAQNELAKEFEGGGVMMETLANDGMTFFYTLLTGLVGVFGDLFAPIRQVWNVLGDLAKHLGLVSEEGNGFATVANVIVGVVKLALTPLTLMANGIAWLYTSIVDFVKESPRLTAAINGFTFPLRAFFHVLQNAPAYLEGFKAAARTAFGSIKDLISAVLSGDLGAIKKAWSDMGQSSSNAFNAAYKAEMDKAAAERKKDAEAETQEQTAQAKKRSEGISAEEKKAREKAAEERRKEREKELEEQRKNEIEATRAIEDLKNELISNDFERKIAVLRTQAEREKAEAKGTAEQIAEQKRLIDEKLSVDIRAIERDRAAERKKIAEQTEREVLEIRNRFALAKSDLAVLQAEDALKTAVHQQGITGRLEMTRQAEDQLLRARQSRLELERQQELASLDQNFREKLQADIVNLQLSGEEKRVYEMNAYAALIAEKQLLDAEYEQAKSDLAKEVVDQRAEYEKQKNAEALSYLQTGYNAYQDFKRIASDKEMAKLDKDKQKRLKDLDLEYKSGRISKENYESSKANIEANYDQQSRSLKRKAAEDEKQANIANAVMQGLVAVVEAAPNIPLQIATAALAALNVAKIIATPIPTFANGGKFGAGVARSLSSAWRGTRNFFRNGGAINPVAGVPSVGQLHSGGGIKMVDGASGQLLGEWERGEPYMILSRDTYANNGPIIDALLDSSLHRGGAPIMQRGGIYAANGAVTGEMPATEGASSGNNDFALLLNEQRATRAAIERIPMNIKAYVVYQDIQDAGELMDEVVSDAAA